MTELTMNPDRLLGTEEKGIEVARRLYEDIKNLPIISPHGHTDPSWFNENDNFKNATDLLIRPIITFLGCYIAKDMH